MPPAEGERWARLELAEKAQQWEDLAGFAREVVAERQPLGAEELRALSRAYVLFTGKLRSEWRGLACIEETLNANSPAAREIAAFRSRLLPALQTWYAQVEEDFRAVAERGADDYSRVFCQRMLADNLRYQLEDFRDLRQSAERRAAAVSLYAEAWERARTALAVTDPLRLALALNYAVAQYELAGRPGQAALFLQEVLADAVRRTEEILPAHFRETAATLQSMRDNVLLWSSGC